MTRIHGNIKTYYQWLDSRSLKVKIITLATIGGLMASLVMMSTIVSQSASKHADQSLVGRSNDPAKYNPFRAITGIFSGKSSAPINQGVATVTPDTIRSDNKSSNSTNPTSQSISAAKPTQSGATASPMTNNGQSKNLQLIVEQASLVLTGGSRETPAYNSGTNVKAASGIELSNPIISGPASSLNIYALPVIERCRTYSGDDQMCSVWRIMVSRLKPEASGTYNYTVSAYDRSGNTYTTKLTVTAKPIPYYTLAPGRTELAYGNSPQWGNLVGLVVHATIRPFNMPDVQLQISPHSFLGNYSCNYSGVYPVQYPLTRQYNSNNDIAVVCWMHQSELEDIRRNPSAVKIEVTAADLFTGFDTQSVIVPVAPF